MPLPYATDGPVCIVPPRIALILEQQGRLDEFRLAQRGRDPELDAVLYALHTTAMRFDTTTSVGGCPPAPAPTPPSSSALMTAAEVADCEGCTAHNVRLARRQGRL